MKKHSFKRTLLRFCAAAVLPVAAFGQHEGLFSPASLSSTLLRELRVGAGPQGGGNPRAQSSRNQPRSLDLLALEELAKENNPTLIQAAAHVRAEQAKALEAGLYPNPRIGYVGDQIRVAGTAGELQGGFIEQEIVTAGKLRLSRQKYEARTKVAELQRDGQALRVLNDVRIHYYRALGRAELVKIHRDLLKTAENHLVTTQEMVNLGQASKADLHLSKAALQQARLDLQMAENDYRATLEQLAAGVGADLGNASLAGSIEGEIQVIDFETALARLLDESPELAMANAEVKADEITVKREKVEAIPNVLIGAGAGRNFETRGTVYTVSVSVEIPLFDRNQGTVLQAKADLERQHAEVRRQELQLRRSFAEQYRQYLTALQHVRDYQRVIVPESRNAYEAKLQGYKENRENWPEVLMVQHEYYHQRAAYIHYLVAWREAEVTINGLLLVDGLMAPDAPLPRGHIDAVSKPR